MSAIGNRPFIRERTREFTTDEGFSIEELISLLRKIRSESEDVLSVLSNDDLSREVIIRYDREDWNRMLQSDTPADETYDTRLIGRLLI
ncbi:hypothetical protein D3C78_965860 [compost metagenome]